MYIYIYIFTHIYIYVVLQLFYFENHKHDQTNFEQKQQKKHLQALPVNRKGRVMTCAHLESGERLIA